MPRGRKPIADHPMTPAGRQRRHRASKPSKKPWWRKVIDQNLTPTNPNETIQLYNALSWLTKELEHKIDPHYIKAGELLLNAQMFFPTKKAWKQWLRNNICSCAETTRAANFYINRANYIRQVRASLEPNRTSHMAAPPKSL